MYDASNRKDIRRAEKEARAAEIARIDYLKAAMSVPQGRHWFHDLLERCHIFADPFSGSALLEAYSKGERNIGLFIYGDIVNNCPDDFVQMIKEANARRITDDARNARDTAAAEHTGGADPGRDAEEYDLDNADTGDYAQ